MFTLKTVFLGFLAGGLSGFFGIGGGILMVPALVYFYGFTQHLAQGTSLAVMLLPVGLPGVLNYYRDGNVDLRVAACLVAGFLVGVTVSSSLVGQIPADALRRGFGVLLLITSIKMMFF